MPLYPHFQEAKKSETLPDAEKVGVCLTCAHWVVRNPRYESDTQQVALCAHPELLAVALIVSGSSACNKWAKDPLAGDEAKAYAERGEAK